MDNQATDAPHEQAAAGMATHSAGRITEALRDRVSSWPPRAAEGIEHAADAARRAAGSLRDRETWLAELVDQGAEQLAQLARTLRTSDLETLVSRTGAFAQRRPVLFTGAAIALGFVLTRATWAASRRAASRT